MAVYNPYAGPPRGDYVEFPASTNPAIINDYYRAVLASRHPYEDKLTGSINALSGVGQNFFNQMLGDSFAQDREARALSDLVARLRESDMLERNKWQDQEQQKRDWEMQDYDFMGRATGAWAEANQPGPDTVNTYEVPGYTTPPTDVNLPGEPGGYVQTPGDVIDPETITTTTEGKRPAPIDAWMRFSGQYPEFAGAMRSKMGAAFGQSVLDPTFQDKRSADIARTEATTNRISATTDPEVARLGASADLARTRSKATNIKMGNDEFIQSLRRKAVSLMDAGREEEANAILSVIASRPWESAMDKEGAKYDARTDRGLTADKPLRSSSTGPKGSVTERLIQRYVDLNAKGQGRTPNEEAEFQVLKKKLMSTNQFEQIMDMLNRGGASNQGQRPSLAPGNPNFKPQ